MLYKTWVDRPTMKFQGDMVKVEVKVPDPKAFCEDLDTPVMKALASKFAEKTGVTYASAQVTKCMTTNTVRRLSGGAGAGGAAAAGGGAAAAGAGGGTAAGAGGGAAAGAGGGA